MKPSTLKTLRQQYLNSGHQNKIIFINSLLAKKVPLDLINVNDWETNTTPAVYLGIAFAHKVKRYARCSPFDLKHAIAYYNKFLK